MFFLLFALRFALRAMLLSDRANFFMENTESKFPKPDPRPLTSKSMTPESSTYSVLSRLKGSKRTLDFSSSTEIKAP
jgi:hypothetical protein